ncbi:MAG: hypothetical protein V4773_09655 [Verrucomicrobiota bacterium]
MITVRKNSPSIKNCSFDECHQGSGSLRSDDFWQAARDLELGNSLDGFSVAHLPADDMQKTKNAFRSPRMLLNRFFTDGAKTARGRRISNLS